MWKVHDKSEMVVVANPESNFPISIELTFGARPGTPARCENSAGAWFGVEDAKYLIEELQQAVAKVEEKMATNIMTQVNKVAEIAAKKEMSFQQFAGQCLLRGLSYDTASRVWNKADTARGFNATTKTIVAEILGRPVRDVFGE